MKRIIATICSIILVMVGITGCAPSEKSISEAINNRDTKELTKIIREYNELDNSKKYDKVLAEDLARVLKDEDVEDYYFIKETQKKVEGSKTDKAIEKVLEENYQHIVKAYLTGKWVRNDGTGLSGIQINVKFTKDNGIAVISDTSNINDNYGKFELNDIKWKDVAIVDGTTINFKDETKWAYTDGTIDTTYDDAIGLINFDEKTVSVHVTSEDYDGKDQIWEKVENGK